ncbi:hypothetical protein Misp06_03445 [Microbulbifer sp. NBRC 101763]|uniref:trypsin-like peptidase domain-containing protein n=1 Tax=Microbulbifer TaxID=48073 RepID=UPI0003610702|nr:trypsin-like peptidase domain-containing protein [Microbulbifer variabilis]
MNINAILGIVSFGALVTAGSFSFAEDSHSSMMNEIPPPPDAVITESICGPTTDWQDVESYNGTLGPTIDFVNTHQGAVGHIRWNNNLNALYNNPGNVNDVRWCTGTLLTNNLFLTAGHCFDQQTNDGRGWDAPIDNTTGRTITSAQHATNMHVEFNYQYDANGTLRSIVSFDIVDLVEYRHGGLDYAVVQLAGNPNSQFPSASLSADIPNLNDQLTIIQHPAGIPKVVDAGQYDGVESSGGLVGYMRYANLDTTGGSSGSGVLDDSGHLIGVHTNAGCTSTGGANHGVLNSDIELVSTEVAIRIDNDNDGLSNWHERQIGTNVNLTDTDGDGIDDKWEYDNGLNPLSVNDAWYDPDNDGYTNLQEYEEGTDPNDPSSNPQTKFAAILIPIVSLLLN